MGWSGLGPNNELIKAYAVPISHSYCLYEVLDQVGIKGFFGGAALKVVVNWVHGVSHGCGHLLEEKQGRCMDIDI